MHRLSSTSVCRYCMIFSGFFIAALLLHYSGFSSPMIYDSKVWISDKAHIFSEGDIGKILSIFPERPLFMLILYLNYLLFGMDPFFFRLVASAFSAAAGLALVLLAHKIFHSPTLETRTSETNTTWVIILLGLLFVIHPLQSFAVLYIWQNQVVLACLFYFSALAAYLTGATNEEGRRTKWYLLCTILFFFGLISKENTSTLPISMVLAELILLGRDFKHAAKRAVVVAAITLPPLIIYLLLAYSLHGQESVIPKGVIARIIEYYGEGGWSPWQVLLTECRVFFTYVASVIVPFAVDLHLVKATLVSSSLLEPPSTLWAASGMVGWIILSVALIRRDPITSFGMLFFFVALLPESALIPQYLFFGYRPILPMAGLLFIIGRVLLSAFAWAEIKFPKGILRGAIPATLFILVGLFAWSSHIEATEWHPLRVWEKAYLGSPEWSEHVEKRLYKNILVNYGAELVNSGKYSDAIPILNQAVQLAPESPSAYNNLANAMLGLGRISQAIEVYQKAIQSNVTTPELFMNLGVALLKSNRIHDAKESFAKAVQIHPGLAKARANLGMVCLRLGQVPEAIEHLSHAVRINPQLAFAHSSLGQALELAGDLSQAASHYTAALRLAPGLTEAHFRLGNVMVKLNDPAAAIEHYKAALQLDPKLYAAENNLGKLYLGMSQLSDAARHFQRALEIRPDFSEARVNLEAVLAKLQGTGDDPGLVK